MLVCFGDHPDHGAKAAEKFLKQNAIIVRMMAGYGLPDCLRITVGTENEMRGVVDALSRFLGKNA